MHFNAAEIKETDQSKGLDKHELAVTSPSKARKRYFCGSQFHIRAKCPAKEAVCHLCKKVGHYARVCQSTKQKSSAFLENSQLATLLTCSGKTHPLAKSCINIMINGSVVNTLVDSGSTDILSILNKWNDCHSQFCQVAKPFRWPLPLCPQK